MNRELNIDSILALDEQIRVTQDPQEIIELKRTRNSLLNIARIPPEILGHIFFHAKVTLGSYTFLHVSHYWHEVARHSPKLWNHWGTSLKDWKRSSRYTRASAKVDLEFEETYNYMDMGCFKKVETLRNTLRNLVMGDLIRKIHLASSKRKLLAIILSLWIPKDGRVRYNSVESISLRNCMLEPYGFFDHQLFPRLRDLSLHCKDLSLVPLKKNTTTLVNLSLSNEDVPSAPAPTTSQIISLLASNPNIRTLHLHLGLFKDDSESNPTDPVPLRYLESFSFNLWASDFYPIMSRLEFFGTVKSAELTLGNCTLETITHVIGPYLRNDLERVVSAGDRLVVRVAYDPRYISITVRIDGAKTLGSERPRAQFYMRPSSQATPEQKRQMCIQALAALPKEGITFLETNFLEIDEMPNLKSLCLDRVEVTDGFLLSQPDGSNAPKNLLPSLRRLHLSGATAKDSKWDPLIHYLSQTDSRSVSLVIDGARVCLGVRNEIEPLVKSLKYEVVASG